MPTMVLIASRGYRDLVMGDLMDVQRFRKRFQVANSRLARDRSVP